MAFLKEETLTHFKSICLALTVFSTLPALAAFDLSPIIATVTPTGPGATTSFTITNSSDSKTPIQVAIYRREPDEDGKEKYEDSKDSGELFQIFPSQVILNPKEKRTLRVTYVGEPKLKEELAFRIIAEEFPINVSDPAKFTKKAVASISILTKYVGSLYVTPSGTAGELTFEADTKKNVVGNQMILTIHNKGTQHYILKQPKLIVTNPKDGKSYPMPSETISSIGTQNILAGRSRKFTFPWPKGVPVGAVKIAIDTTVKK